MYPYGFEKQHLIVRIELNSPEKVILCTGDTSATYKLSDISIEYDAIFDESYATIMGQMYIETSIPYTKVELIHYHTLSKKDTIWKIDMNNLSVCSLQGLLLLFIDKKTDFANKNEEFYNPNIKKTLVTINGLGHQLFKHGLQARDIYPEIKKYFYKEDSHVTWEEFLTTKFGLWIDTRSSTENIPHGSGRAVEKGGILVQVEKIPEADGSDLTCCVFSLVHALDQIETTYPSTVLTIEK